MRRIKAEYIGTALFAILLALPFLPGAGHHGEAWSDDGALDHPTVDRDWVQIKRDTLRILVMPDPLTWEQRPGAVTGLEWELLERFAQKRRIPVKAIPVSDRDSMLAMLQSGLGDVMAAQLSPHGWASSYVHFTRSYHRVGHADAFAKGESGMPFPRAGTDTLAISAWSPFLDGQGKPGAWAGDKPYVVLDLLPEELLVRTALARQQHSLVTDACASMEAKRLPLVRFGAGEGPTVALSFGLRSNSVHLQHLLDHWLASSREYEARQALITAYNKGLDTRNPQRSLRILTAGADSISTFDSLFQVHADSMAWDWKLLAAVAFKESRFDTSAVSRKGAGGLMQLMPATAAQMGVTDSSGVEGHIQGATRYLDRMDQIWQRDISSPAQRLKFVLAAYNAGPGHVKDAQRLAVELGMDPSKWDGNVERAMVLLNRPRYFTSLAARNGYSRGQDTYWYVRDVVGLYGWLSGKDPH
ncbi:MAG TPA: transglycosylase SLT domain-containing protein [Flavobacteriales bacterium]|nr:transglycosylase SLT domain-containing protein [Flavobacteriales bacterium]